MRANVSVSLAAASQVVAMSGNMQSKLFDRKRQGKAKTRSRTVRDGRFHLGHLGVPEHSFPVWREFMSKRHFFAHYSIEPII